MSDESSKRTSAGDSAADDADASSGGLEPGGGPQRVVSDQSVDDILNSLDETKSSGADATGAAGSDSESDGPASPAETDESTSERASTASDAGGDVTTAFDEDEVPAADDATDDSDGDANGAATESAAAATVASDESEAGAPNDVESAASALPGDASDADLEELAARVEDGTVTGADVRAAEAGEGRESTPEVDEIQLSMDDLEETQAATSSPGGPAGGADLPDDAGPLAGSVERDGTADSSDGGDDGDDSPGLFGRIKRFFGG